MEIPKELDCAKVILHTSNSISNRFGTIGILGENEETVDELPITAMAICQYEGKKNIICFLVI